MSHLCDEGSLSIAIVTEKLDMTGEGQAIPVSSLTITVPLDPSNPAQNIFSYAQLRTKHIQRIREQFKVNEPTPVVSQVDLIDEISEDEEQDQTKRRKVHPDDEYDLEDDWIDDTEAFNAEMEGNAGPIWEYGFFAWKGPIDSLFEQKYSCLTSDKKLQLEKTDIKSTATGIAHPVEEKKAEESPKKKADEPSKTKKKSKKKEAEKSTKNNAEENPRKNSARAGSDLPTMPKLVEAELAKLEKEAGTADFTEKKHFPQQLKPLYHAAVSSAMDHNALDANFFQHITKILPYNTFTMKKLASRLVYPDRLKEIKEKLPAMYQDFAKQVTTLAGENNTEVSDTPSQRKVKFNEQIRVLFWNILCMEWEMAQMDNDIKTLNKETPAYQESAVRRAVYQKMVSSCAQGVLETSFLSTQYSQFKKKREKAIAPDGYQAPENSPFGVIRVDPFAKTVAKPRKKDEPETPTQVGEKRKSMEDTPSQPDKKTRV